ncbi:uncharacterized protein LODBEIA_P55690 [Lodderomyces beijingensis]|uniref:t-SNARE coiled-coil homology domain-containing protein n=1 Tax=Lodderomyces beijingensis TaxID=1775926 RepID=A0ABP0ZVH8_9ASCO
MDPFNDVREDADVSIRQLESTIAQLKQSNRPPSVEQSQDFENQLRELHEISQELKDAVDMSSAEPEKFDLTSSDIRERNGILQTLTQRIGQIEHAWQNSKNGKLREVTTMSNRISQDENPFAADFAEGQDGSVMSNYQQQEMIQEQDTQLDDIHRTMMNLNQQAVIMGDELEDQAFMLDELDYELDHVDNKLQRGMKRLNVFIERNKETASNWCIAILVVVLCVLLVVLLIA